jgi:hypothetical protein
VRGRLGSLALGELDGLDELKELVILDSLNELESLILVSLGSLLVLVGRGLSLVECLVLLNRDLDDALGDDLNEEAFIAFVAELLRGN